MRWKPGDSHQHPDGCHLSHRHPFHQLLRWRTLLFTMETRSGDASALSQPPKTWLLFSFFISAVHYWQKPGVRYLQAHQPQRPLSPSSAMLLTKVKKLFFSVNSSNDSEKNTKPLNLCRELSAARCGTSCALFSVTFLTITTWIILKIKHWVLPFRERQASHSST